MAWQGQSPYGLRITVKVVLIDRPIDDIVKTLEILGSQQAIKSPIFNREVLRCIRKLADVCQLSPGVIRLRKFTEHLSGSIPGTRSAVALTPVPVS